MATTATLYATTATQVAGTTSSWTTLTNATGSTSGTYAVWSNSTASTVAGVELSGYNGQTAIGTQPSSIDAVTATVKWYTSTATTRITSATAQLYSGTTAIGAAQALTVSATTTNSQTVTFPTMPTWAQASDLRVRLTFNHFATAQTVTINVDYVGFTLGYTAAAPGTPTSSLWDWNDGTLQSWNAGNNWTIAASTAQSHSAGYSLLCTRSNATAGFGYAQGPFVPVVAGTDYTISWWVYASAATLYQVSVAGNVSTSRLTNSTFTPTVGAWVQFSAQFTAGPSDTSVSVYLTDDPNGTPTSGSTIYLDDMLIQPVSAAVPVDLSGFGALSVTTRQSTTYYVSAAGSDTNDGKSTATPWATVSKVNSASLNPGDSVLFRGGDTFTGEVYIGSGGLASGTAANPVTFGSYGTGRATITNSTGHGFNVYNAAGLVIKDLLLAGTGTSFTNKYGISLYKDSAGRADYVQISNVESYGWQYGISVGGSAGGIGFSNVTATGCVFRNNRENGFVSYGPSTFAGTYSHSNITLTNCSAYDNEGNSTVTNHTGSGVILGSVDGGLIDQCVAYSNGSLNASTVGGPVGLWAYNANAVVISRSLSYDNHSGTNLDGGGFDLDMNVSNSRIEYCLAYNNDGAGILLFGDTGNTNHTGNVVRYNLLWGNGRSAGNYGDITLYGNVRSSTVYGNTAVSVTNGTVQPSPIWITAGTPSGNTVRNNIFQVRSTASVVKTTTALASTAVLFQGNAYHSTGTLGFTWGGSTYATLAAWRAAAANQETVSGSASGFVGDPLLVNPGISPTVTDPTVLTGASGLALQTASPVARAGLDLVTVFGTSIGTRDYFGAPLTAPYSVGAAEQDTAAAVPVGVSLSGAGTLSAAASGFTGSTTAALAGAGSLTATPAAAATGPAALDGNGTLSATLTASGTISAALSGAGSLTPSVQPLATRTAGMTGLGAVTTAAVPGLTVAAPVSGSGALTSTVTPIAPRSAGLVGTGALAVSTTVTAQFPCPLTGAGALSATTSAPTEISAVALGGSGSFSAMVTGSTTSITAPLFGTGTLATGTGSQVPPITIPIAGVGTLTAQLDRAATLPVGLTGSGALSTTVTAATTSSASLSGTGTLGAALASARTLSVALAGSGSLTTATGSQAPPSTVDLLGAGILSATVVPMATRSAPLAGSGALVAAVASAAARSVALTGAGALTAALGTGASSLVVSLSGSGRLAVTVATTATGVDLPPLTGPVTAAFRFDGAGTAVFVSDGVTAATFSSDGATTGTFSSDGVGAGYFA